jgi:hypothetical protein
VAILLLAIYSAAAHSGVVNHILMKKIVLSLITALTGIAFIVSCTQQGTTGTSTTAATTKASPSPSPSPAKKKKTTAKKKAAETEASPSPSESASPAPTP